MAQPDHQGLSPGSAWLPARGPSLPTPAPLQVPRGGGCCLPAPWLVLGDPALALEVAPGAQGTGTLALTLKSGHRPSPRGQGDACCHRQWGSRELGPHCPALVVGQGRLSLLGVTSPSTSGGQGRVPNLGWLFCSLGSLARQVTVPPVCRSSPFPSRETMVQALHPAPGRDLPLFLLFLPPKLGGGSMWAGSTVPPSAKPTGGWRDNSRFLPSPSLPRAVTGGGSSIARWQSTSGEGGTEVPSLCPPWTGKEGGTISDRKNLPSSFSSH